MRPAANPFAAREYGHLEPLTPRALIWRNIVNSTIFVGSRGLAVVDTQVNHALARRLRDRLAREFDAIASVPEFPREVKLLHEGAVLRLSGDKRLSLYALGERAVRLEVQRVRPGELGWPSEAKWQ